MQLPHLSSYTEKELLSRISMDDERAFRVLFDNYSNKVYSWAFYITKSEYIAEEITQEVFLKIWINRKQLNEINYLNAYLNTISRNIAYNHLKKLATEKLVLQSLGNEVLQSADDTYNTILNSEYGAILAQAIKQLPQQQKMVYVLSRHHGLKQKDVAEKMGLSIYTVKEYMKKAHSSVRQFIQERIELVIMIIAYFIF